MLSRVLGLVRDTLTASAFGTSSAMSDFVVAFRIPNMFRALFGEGALSSAFVPVYLDTRTKEGEASAWRMSRKVITLLGATLLALVILGILGCTLLMAVPEIAGANTQVLSLARIMLPYMLFICLAALSTAILNSHHRFSLPAFTPSLLNITWILFVLFVCPLFGTDLHERIYGVAWAVFFAGLVQLGAQLPAMWALGWRPGLDFDTKDERVTRFLKLMGPTALGSSVSQINVFVNGLLALWAAPWAPAALFFAERLLYFPQGILATAMSTVLLPVFSGHAADGDHTKIRDTLNHALRTLLFVMAPASVGLFALAEPIVQLVFGWGKFNQESVAHTALVLRCYAPGLFVFGLAKVFVPVFYALHNTRTPFRIGLVSVGLNFALNILFTLTFPRDLKAASLAAATVLSEAFNGIALGVYLHRTIGSPGWSSILRGASRAIGGASLMAAVALLVHHYSAGWMAGLHLPAKAEQVTVVVLAMLAAAVSYFAFALVIRSPEIGDVTAALKRRRARRVDPRE